MAKKPIDSEILNIVNKFFEEAKKYYKVESIILFGSYAKGNASKDSDIDVAVIMDDFEDEYDCMAELMGLTWDIDARIEPHPIKKEEFEKVAYCFIKEVVDTGIKVA